MANQSDIARLMASKTMGAPQTITSPVVAPKADPMMANPYQAYKDHPFLMGLSTLAMGVGEGMTGRPFLTNFNNNLYEQKQAQLKYKQWQEEQDLAKRKMEIEEQNAPINNFLKQAKMIEAMVAMGIPVPEDVKRASLGGLYGVQPTQTDGTGLMKRNKYGVPEPLSPKESVDVRKGEVDIKKGEVELAKESSALQAQTEQQKAAAESARASAQDMLDTIAEIKKGASNFGLMGSVPKIPGTTQKTWELNFDKFKSKKIIDLMAEMKNVSKTGATGFGQLSEKELKILQDASTALSKDLPKKKAVEYLNKAESVYKKFLKLDELPSVESLGLDPNKFEMVR